MNIDKGDNTEKLSQMIGLIAEGIAIGALFVTVLLFVGRFTLCMFYGLPVIYDSLNTLKAIPIGISVFLLFTYSLVSYNSLFYESYRSRDEERLQKSDEVQQNNLASIKGSGWLSFLASILSIAAKGVKKDQKTKSVIDRYFEKMKNKTYSQRNAKILFVGLLLVYIFFSGWMYLSQIMLQRNMRLGFFIVAFSIIVFFICVAIFSVFYLASLIEEIKELLNKQISTDRKCENGESVIPTTSNEVAFKIALNTLLTGFLVINLFISLIFCSKSISLSLKDTYGIVETNNDGDKQQYAIVLSLEDYYVLEPVSVMKDGLGIRINSGQFMFVDKDNVLVTFKSYPMIIIDR